MPSAVITPAAGTSRRSWLWRAGSLALAAAAAVAIGVFVANQPPREVTAQQLAADISQWYGESSKAQDWNPAASPQQVSINRYVVGRGALPWRSYKTPAGETATVYQVAGRQVLLFVVATNAKYPVGHSPGNPLPSMTGGIAAIAWQQSGKLYVLVGKGTGDGIKAYVKENTLG